MELLDLYTLVGTNTYPGRGIVLGLTPKADKAMLAYFIMGRSGNSRNRVFEARPQTGGIRTKAADPAKLEDPSLIIYHPVRTIGTTQIVTNGDQTDTIYQTMMQGGTFEQALRTRTFEPDAPNFTPRISGLLQLDDSQARCSYKLSILKSADGNPQGCRRYFYEYQPVAGEGHFIHTYRCDGAPIPSFEGEPWRVQMPQEPQELAEKLWNSLNPDNKVSLFVRSICLTTGQTQDVLINQYHSV